MRTAVMTDSNSGITCQEGEELGIYVLPMPVIVDNVTYFENKDITMEEFYASMEAGKQITSSQPSPGDVEDMWNTILSNGYDEVVYIPMSSGLSSSCHVAISLAEEFNGKVCVADNHRISVTLRQSVLDAKKMADFGMDAKSIKAKLEELGGYSSIYIAVDTLEYLKRGGRVTPAGAAIGSALNIKPILTIQGEKLDAYAKVRGIKKCEKKILEAVKKDLETRFTAIPAGKLVIGAAGTFLNKEDADNWENEVRETFPQAKVYYNQLSLSIGCHVGPNAIGIGISEEW